MIRCKTNNKSLNIILLNIKNYNTLNQNTNRINILNNNNTLRKGKVGILEVEDNNKEEDLVEEEAKSYVIIMDNQDTLPKIAKVLRRNVHTVKHLNALLNNVRNWLRKWQARTVGNPNPM